MAHPGNCLWSNVPKQPQVKGHPAPERDVQPLRNRFCRTSSSVATTPVPDGSLPIPADPERPLPDRAHIGGPLPRFSPAQSPPLVIAGVTTLLAVLVLQLDLTARRNSITWDQDDHIYAGYMSWKHADFGLNPEHPPLVKLLAAIPLLDLSLKVPPLQNRAFKHEAFLGGKDFLFQNDADTILLRARMAAALLTVLLVVLVFFATQEMFGTGAAFIALASCLRSESPRSRRGRGH
jgi:hypothetical protein